MILPLSCFSRQGRSTNILLPQKSLFWKIEFLTSGHLRSRSRIDLNRSCCIAFDVSWRYEHFGTYLMSLSHSNQKLCLKRNVYWLYDVIIWLGLDTSSATICKKKIKLFQTGKMRRIAWCMSLRSTLVPNLLFFYMCDSVLRSRWFHWTDSFSEWLPNFYWCIACFCEWNQ